MVVEREVVRAGGVGVNLAGAGTGRARVTRRHNRKGHICPKPRRTTRRRVGRERRGTRGVDVSGNDDACGRVQIRRAREDGATMRARAPRPGAGAPRVEGSATRVACATNILVPRRRATPRRAPGSTRWGTGARSCDARARNARASRSPSRRARDEPRAWRSVWSDVDVLINAPFVGQTARKTYSRARRL